MKKILNNTTFRVFVLATVLIFIISASLAAVVLGIYPTIYRTQITNQNQQIVDGLVDDLNQINSVKQAEQVVLSYKQEYNFNTIIVNNQDQVVVNSGTKNYDLDELKVNSHEGNVVVAEYDDKEVDTLTFRQNISIKDIDYTLYTIINITPLAELLVPFKRILPFVVILVIVQGLIITFIFRAIYKKPIKQMSSKARAISNLQFDNDISLNRSDDYGNLSQELEQVQAKMQDLLVYFEDDLYLKSQLVIEEQKHRVAILSHELNTPLTVLRMQNEILLQTDLEQTTREFIERNLVKIDEVISLVSELLNNKIIDDQMVDVDLVTNVQTLISDTYENQDIKLNANDNPRIYVSPVYLKRIIVNMINNAVKYKVEGSTIVINITNSKLQVINSHGNDFKFDKKELLKPYIRGVVDSDSISQGLGLYICTRISTLCGYKFDIDANDGKFIATLTFDEEK